MSREVDGGELSFWYYVSSESGYDYFNFYVDGERDIHASGTSAGWQFYSAVLDPGDHVLKWEYDKDWSEDDGSDTVWIDDLALVDDSTQWTDIIGLTEVGASSVEWTPEEVSEDCKVRVRAYYDGGFYGMFDESDGVFAVIESSCPADINGDGAIDVLDLLMVLSAWGGTGGPEDINGDGVVDVLDLLEVLSGWGAC